MVDGNCSDRAAKLVADGTITANDLFPSVNAQVWEAVDTSLGQLSVPELVDLLMTSPVRPGEYVGLYPGQIDDLPTTDEKYRAMVATALIATMIKLVHDSV